MKDTIRKIIKEADTSRYGGYYTGPLTMGEIDWDKSALGPFTKKVSNFFNADLQYDSYDGTLDSHKKDSKKLESKSKKISKYNKNHKQFNDEDGNPINATPGKGKKIVPIVGEWVDLNAIPLNEDLAVWFGTKKKPKGSKQPKGPWVNICRKVDGKHPPCGRSNTDKGGYPKCRAAGVAGKMSDSEKKSACQQKRRAEKKDTQTGKGQKPIMTSYKKKKTNEDMKRILKLTENDISRIVNKVLKEETRSVISEQKRGKWGDYIKQDFRKEKNKKLIIRPLLTKEEFNQNLNDCIKKTGDKNSCLASTTKQSNDQWEELIYGYKGITSENQDRMVISKGSVESPGYMIEYNCDTGQVSYKLTNGSDWVSNTNDENQNRKDSNWLKRWCSNITWTSDVGQKRKLFRNPKIY
jgi:hypothetical protein